MKKQKGKRIYPVLVSVLAALLVLTSFPVTAAAAADSETTVLLWVGNETMLVDGVKKSIDSQGSQPVIVSSRTFLPIRAVIEAFGGTVSWNATTKEVTLKSEKNILQLWVGNSTAKLNGIPVSVDPDDPSVKPLLIKGRTMLPVRFAAEALGIDVQYLATDRKITLTGSLWNHYTMAQDGFVGENSSIALDPNGKVHISYIDSGNGNLCYMTDATGSWVTWIIGPASNHSTSIAADSAGKCHIVYDGTNGELLYATNETSGAGTITKVAESAWAGLIGSVDIALDSNEEPQITYFVASDLDLRYATKASGSWSTISITEEVGGMLAYSASLQLDAAGYSHLCVYDDSAPDSIKYISNSSGKWEGTTVDQVGFAAGWSTALELDGKGNVHILYYNWDSDSLMYANNVTGQWVSEVVIADGGNVSTASMAIDENNDDQIHIIFKSGAGLMHTTKINERWFQWKIDESWTGTSNSVDIFDGKIYLSYYDGYKSDLRYAWKTLY